MKCKLIVYFEHAGGSFGIEKELDLPWIPRIGEDIKICDDSGCFYVSAVTYDVDRKAVEIRVEAGDADLNSVQSYIDSGFKNHDMGLDVPESLVFKK